MFSYINHQEIGMAKKAKKKTKVVRRAARKPDGPMLTIGISDTAARAFVAGLQSILRTTKGHPGVTLECVRAFAKAVEIGPVTISDCTFTNSPES